MAAAGVLLWIYFFTMNATGNSRFLPKCIFFEVTSLHCPGCGLTRSLCALTRLDFHGFFRNNIMVLPMAACFLLARLRPGGLSNGHLCIIAAILVIFSVLRNLPFYPFVLLAPI